MNYVCVECTNSVIENQRFNPTVMDQRRESSHDFHAASVFDVKNYLRTLRAMLNWKKHGRGSK